MTQFYIPGINHGLLVKVVSAQYLRRAYPEKLKKSEQLKGFFLYGKNTIYISRDLERAEFMHVLCREWSHGILSQLGCEDTENRCDQLGVLLTCLFAESLNQIPFSGKGRIT